MNPAMLDDLIAPVLAYYDQSAPGDGIGVYLYGSSVAGTLRPDGDVDLLVLTRRSLTHVERASWVSLLLQHSGWRGHAARFPEVGERRPLELTSLVVEDVQRWRWIDPILRDFQYGEWLREELLAGLIPQPASDPDVVVLVANALTTHRVLRGPALDEVVPPVPPTLLRQAVRDVIPAVLGSMKGDERNVLLTLARILITVTTGQIVAKDAAVDALSETLSPPDRQLMEYARAAYLGEVVDDWSSLTTQSTDLAQRLADRALSEVP